MKRLIGGIQTNEKSTTVLAQAFCLLCSQKKSMIQIILYFPSMSFLHFSLSLLPPPINRKFHRPWKIKSGRLFHTPTHITVRKITDGSFSAGSPSLLLPVNGPNALSDLARQRFTGSCIEEDQPYRKMNKTHHFHKYEKAIDGQKLMPLFR